MDPVGRGEHVAHAENRIKIIKERVRGIINTLPFRLTPKLGLFCVVRVSQIPRSHDAIKSSPWERYYGRKLDYQKDLKAGFGDYIQAHENETDNMMKARTKGGIACLPLGNEDNLATEMLIRRDRFTVLPMPNEIINYLDNLAEQKGAVAEVKAEVGDREINDDGTDSRDTKFLEFVRSIED